MYSTVQKFTEKQQFNTIPVPFVNGKHISSSDYKEQTWKEVFYKSDHKKRTILEVFVWLVPLRESVLFWAWGFVCFELWVEGGGGCCWGFFLFFLPTSHSQYSLHLIQPSLQIPLQICQEGSYHLLARGKSDIRVTI